MTDRLKELIDQKKLITPDDLPMSVRDSLSLNAIRTLGYWLYAQLKHQHEFSVHTEESVNTENCSHMAISEFVASVQDGFFTEDDGFGCYATDSIRTDIHVSLAEMRKGIVRHEWTHVCWYNR